MSERQARRRRQLQAVIPTDKKKEMKERITARHMKRNTEVSKIRKQLGIDIVDLKHKAEAAMSEINDAYEIERTEIITNYENEYGRASVEAVLAS